MYCGGHLCGDCFTWILKRVVPFLELLGLKCLGGMRFIPEHEIPLCLTLTFLRDITE